MKNSKIVLSAALFISSPVILSAQNLPQKLDSAVKKLLNSEPATAAVFTMYVTDDAGQMIYQYNPNMGISSASTQKIFTAAAALESLGKGYTYSTNVSYSGNITQSALTGNLWVTSNGDPTLGSWRYDGYKPEDFKRKFLEALQQKGIRKIEGDLIIDDSKFDFQTVPGGWPWNDMGNYYGAGVWGVNWRENQFDIQMNGKTMGNLNVELPQVSWVNDVQTAGSSDQSLIFTAPHSNIAYISGKLPAKSITVSGATPNPPLTLGAELRKWMNEAGISFNGKILTASQMRIEGKPLGTSPAAANSLLVYKSPTLDKMVYFFLRKSVNLYGETFIKTMALEKKNSGNFDVGVAYLKDFWKSKGINPALINFADGSGLSPQNYVASKAEVQALLYAQKQPWFKEFFDGFPKQDNGMKMKSGTMKDTKSFAGYHTSSSGKKYVFSIMINNYQGSGISAALQEVLNQLK